MHIDFFLDVFREQGSRAALIWKGQAFGYSWLLDRVDHWCRQLDGYGVTSGRIVAVESDFSPETVALLLALTERCCILVPLLRQAPEEAKSTCLRIAQVEAVFYFDEEDRHRFQSIDGRGDHEHYRTVRERRHPALVLFTSGSSGNPKAAVHDFPCLLEKFRTRRPCLSMLNFLLFDHWGGLNTLFHCLSNGATIFTVQDRNPDAICALIEKYRIQVLPASPTFLNLMIIGEAHLRHDLSSLKLITYGAEPMPETTLQRLHGLFPNVKLHQTYGLIELGVFRSKSESSESLWVKLDMRYRVVEGILQIKTASAMLGYLNAPSPFTDDGWYDTGDAVLMRNGYLRILGRRSELINVGGEKVFPQEVENVIQQMPSVCDVRVYKEPNPITGNIVCAEVALNGTEDPRLFTRNLKRFCRERLQGYKVPVRVKVVDRDFMTVRGKKSRFCG